MYWFLYDRDFRHERGKMLLQEQCKQKLEWDEEVIDKLSKVQKVNLKELKEIGGAKTVLSRELHGFNDATKKFNHYVI